MTEVSILSPEMDREKMLEQEIKNTLDEYSNNLFRIEMARADYTNSVRALLTEEQKTQMALLDLELEEEIEQAERKNKILKDAAIDAAKKLRKTVRGKYHVIHYYPPKTVCSNVEGLVGYAQANPDVLAFIGASKPRTSLRKA